VSGCWTQAVGDSAPSTFQALAARRHVDSLPTVLDMQALDVHFGSTLPERLYHYTDQAGLLGVSQSSELWATQIQYLNDAREFYHAAEWFHGVGLDDWGADVVVRPVIDYVGDLVATQSNNRVCVASLSEEGDLLSQWRGYTSPGDGFSLGFEGTDLEDAVARQPQIGGKGWVLGRVTYDAAEQRKLASELMAEVGRRCHELRDEQKTKLEVLDGGIARLLGVLLQFGPLMKDGSFAEEKEWRLISPPVPHGHGFLGFRPGPSSLLPFVRFGLTKRPNALRLPEVIVGPGPHPRLSCDATSALLCEHKINHTVVRPSQVTYRPW
jgi:hypothetical protein